MQERLKDNRPVLKKENVEKRSDITKHAIL